MKKTKADVLRERIDALADELARLESRPEEPPVGAVLRFNMEFPGTFRSYDYAALRAGNGLWYTTGPRSPKGYTWEQLLDWMSEGTDKFEVMVHLHDVELEQGR